MSLTKLEMKYRCSDDCKQSGCPSHVAEMEYQSVTDILHFKDGYQTEFYLERGSLNAFLTLLAKLGRGRVEIESELKNAYQILTDFRAVKEGK